MSEQELWMSQRDRERLKVLHEAEKGHLTQRQAGERLKLSERWVRKLVGRLGKEGDGGILHRLRGRASKRKIPEAVRQRAVRLVRREYADFGPTLAAEYLAKEHRVEVSKETLRKWLSEAGGWKRKRRRGEEGEGWRARQAKGRVERFFGTAQDRLVKGRRKAGVRTWEEANAYLEQEYLPLWNRRFTPAPANATDAHRPLGREHDLAAILSHVESRVVANDYTIRYG